MTIFDLPALSADECFKLIRKSLEIQPDLLRIFDEATIADLVRRRRAFDNALLLRLVQPGDEAANKYWRDVVSDLKVLEDEGAFEEFRHKLRRYKPTDVEQARTELWFPAWLKRNGENISLEPEARNGRKCEFVLLSSPTTWWEIKTPLDLPHILAQAAVEMDVHRRLRYIPQPFVLSLHKVNLPLDAVPKVVKSIKKQISDFYAAGGSPPSIFRESCMINGTFVNDALVVGLDTTTKRESGYLGTLLGKEQIFQGENAARVVKRVLAAAEQIPKSGGGVVVIDGSSSDWIDRRDVIDACFGEEVTVFSRTRLIEGRRPGAFHDQSTSHISAVISYSRRWRAEADVKMTVLHNPNAIVPLDETFLCFQGVEHLRQAHAGNSLLRFVRKLYK